MLSFTKVGSSSGTQKEIQKVTVNGASDKWIRYGMENVYTRKYNVNSNNSVLHPEFQKKKKKNGRVYFSKFALNGQI